MKRVGVVAAVALVASVLGSGYVPARSQATPTFRHLIGALHEHSGYSDGFPGSEPRDYFESGKASGLDFMGSGEHSDNADVPIVASEWCIDEPPADPTIPDCAIADKDTPEDSFRKWDATQEAAQAASTDAFTAFRGFEWTSDRFGHINVYFSRHDTNAKVDGGYGAMDTFWEWLTRKPSLGGGADGLATFNHPGAKSLDDADPGFNWNGFAYVPEADQRMVGLEVFNGEDEFEVKNGRGYFTQALDAGWHVGAIGAEDKGHDWTDGDGQGDDDWGGPVWPKTVVIATDNSPAAIREAMIARRFYAVRDNSIRIELSAGGRPMGARIRSDDAVPFTASTNVAGMLEVVSNGGEIVASATGTTIATDLPPPSATGDEERYYYLRLTDSSGKPQAFSSPVWVSRAAVGQAGSWLAGDLHIHTTYSHDSYGGPTDDNTGPEEFYTLGHTPESQFAVAAARGLDYLALTDHNDIRSQDHFGFAEQLGLVPIPSYENSLDGHAQMHGARKLYDYGSSTAQVQQAADDLRADGGVFQINHPMEGTTDHGATPDWEYGYDVVPDVVEVWNISRLWQPPAPSASSNDDAIKYWEGFLDRGFKVGATGGADNHYIATTPVQGAGQPTTWVFARDRSQQAVLEGLREGRTFITHQPPNHGGPQIFLEGDSDGDGTYESIVGDTIPSGASLRVRVTNGSGSLLSVITNGGELAFAPVPVMTPTFEHRFTLSSASSWVRAEIGEPDGAAERAATCDQVIGGESTYCRNRLLALAMTSALYLSGDPDPDPTPTPSGSATMDPTEDTTLQFTSDSAQSGQYTDDARFETLLTTEAGTPIANQEIAFELVGSTTRAFTATTDERGIASHLITLGEQPGPYQLVARYAGIEDRYAPAANTAGFVVAKEDTSLDLTAAGRGANRTLTATLTDADSSAGIAGRPIDFTSDGTVVCTVSTDAEGRATCDPGIYKPKDDYQATFREDEFYLRSESPVL